ncbi:MAG: DUF882 domain-containing protein [Polyangiaceae bacterium]|nr:DUF882 domain-containing protein [Polyangiaceae bacterium]
MTRDRFLQRVPPRASAAARITAASAIGLASLTAVPGARATLLDEPPKAISLKLDDPAAPKLSLLRAFYNAEIERPGPLRRYVGGPWGSWRQTPWQTLSWGVPSARGLEASNEQNPAELAAEDIHHPLGGDTQTPAFPHEHLFGFEPKETFESLTLVPDAAASSTAWLKNLDPEWSPRSLVSTGASLASSGFDLLWTPPPKPVRDWRCRRRPVTFMRHGAENDTFELVRCDGSIAPEALDRISIMARPPEAKGPDGLLPDEPQSDAWEKREWLPQIRLVHPRLLWALQRVADAFPFRAIYIYSGYRPGAIVRGGTHQSLHAEARAMDISVHGVSNVMLFDLCRKLDDVGCGYYPNSKFIHIDVRRPGVGHALWIDASGPGEPPRYVDSWPGVVIEGAMAWSAQREDPVQAGLVSGSSAVCSSGPDGAEKR